METTTAHKKYSFLKGEGEMAKLTREFDWSQTEIGSPDHWPLSLRTTVSMILSSRFPMFLWWGEEMIQFYNDAYRPSLGNNGKHPAALGQHAHECWPEIWSIIYPLIRQVQTTGEATWSEDQLVPIYRNGKIEDVYWTFGYSPIRGETDEVEGVLVVCHETTEKIKTVKKLKESEKRFQTLIRDAKVGLVVLSTDDLVIDIINDEYAKLIGRTYDDLIGQKLYEVLPETSEASKKILHEVLTKGTTISLNDHPFSLNVNRQKKEGYVNLIYQPYHEEDGKITGVMILCQDVTQQVVNARKLQRSEERIRSLVESAPFPIGVYIEREMRIELTNKALIETWGKGDNLIGKLYKDVLPELENQQIYPILEHVYDTGIPYHAKNQRVDMVVNNVLQTFYFNYSFTPLFDNNGKVYGVMNTAFDITDLISTKQKLERSEANLRNTILQAPVAMCILKGKDHIVTLGNDLMFTLWGKKKSEMLGKPLFEGLQEAKDQGYEGLLDGVYNSGEAFSAEASPVKLPRNGKPELVYVTFLYEAYREANGTVSGILVVAYDVTPQVNARHKIEEVVNERTKELASVNENLYKSNAELAQFAYIASHDLQEPLRKISTYAQMLEGSLGELDERSKSYLAKINMASSRMNTLIRDVLAYSELAKENELFSDTDLNKVIKDVMEDFELPMERKGASIHFNELPVIEAIPLQMSQLFSNLLSNSLKFSRNNVKPVISITCKKISGKELPDSMKAMEKSNWYMIEFRDNGIGFKHEYAGQIFNIFQRLHRKSEYEGTGIGLAMCKKIAQNHHGELYAEGNENGGAVFNILLPATQKDAKLML